MGLYGVECPVCRQIHLWFSGDMDQRCQICKEAGVEKQKKVDVKEIAEGLIHELDARAVKAQHMIEGVVLLYERIREDIHGRQQENTEPRRDADSKTETSI